MDVINYTKSNEAYEYLHKVNMLDDEEELQIIERERIYAECEEEAEEEQTWKDLKENNQPNQENWNIWMPHLFHSDLSIQIWKLLFIVIWMYEINNNTYMSILILPVLVFLGFKSKFFFQNQYSNRIPNLLKEILSLSVDKQLSAKEAQLIWKNVKIILRPLLIAKWIKTTGRRDEIFIREELFEQESGFLLSNELKLARLIRVLIQTQNSLFVTSSDGPFNIFKKIHDFSLWETSKAEITAKLIRYVEILHVPLLVPKNLSLNSKFEEDKSKSLQKRKNLKMTNQMLRSLLRKINMNLEGSQIQDQTQQENLCFLKIIELSLLQKLKEKVNANDRSEEIIRGCSNNQSDDDDQYLDEKKKEISGKNYQFSFNAYEEDFSEMTLEEDITNLRDRLNLILLKKVNKQQEEGEEGEEQKQENEAKEKKRENLGTLFERERRVEGFGKLFSNLKVDFSSNYIE